MDGYSWWGIFLSNCASFQDLWVVHFINEFHEAMWFGYMVFFLLIILFWNTQWLMCLFYPWHLLALPIKALLLFHGLLKSMITHSMCYMFSWGVLMECTIYYLIDISSIADCGPSSCHLCPNFMVPSSGMLSDVFSQMEVFYGVVVLDASLSSLLLIHPFWRP